MKGALKNLQAGMRFSDHKAGENGVVVSVPGADEVDRRPSPRSGSRPPRRTTCPGLPDITTSMSQHVLTNSYGSVANFIGSLPEGNGQTLLQYFNGTPPQDGAVFTSTPTFTIDERINAAYFEGSFARRPAQRQLRRPLCRDDHDQRELQP